MDLFVRVSNKVAIDMYTKFGYTVYRRVLGYYSGPENEDAFGECHPSVPLSCASHFTFLPCLPTDMRKALPRDVNKQSIIPLKHPVRPEDVVF